MARTLKSKTTDANTRAVSKAQVKEIVDQVLRTAFRDHSRDLETHLKSIHERLVTLERSK